MSASKFDAWRCAVCGYIHRGDEPPADCPVCGVSKEEFEGYQDPATEPTQVQAKRWRCTVCGYIHEGDGPPESCVLCGADQGQFEAAEEESVEAASNVAGHIVVLGGGIAGVSAAEAARKAAPQARITLLSREERYPYYRLNLTRYLAGEVVPDALPIHREEWYAEQRVELQRGVSAMRVDPAKREVELRGGDRLNYDKLILACGAHAFVPPIPGAERNGVMTLRTAGEAERILDAVKGGARVVCIGGGLLGLETAGALARQQADVTVLEGHESLMPRQLDPQAGKLLARHLGTVGVKLVMPARVKELVGEEHVSGVLLEGGDTVPADLVILATGVRSNTHLARQAGLNVKHGIVIDNRLFTSNPDILAAGDSAEHAGVLYGNWFVAQSQGSLAGTNAAGKVAEFGGVPRSHTLKVLGLDTFSIGQFVPQDGSYTCVAGEGEGTYSGFVFQDNVMVGANLMGDTRLAGAVKHAIETRADYSALLRKSPSAQDVLKQLG